MITEEVMVQKTQNSKKIRNHNISTHIELYHLKKVWDRRFSVCGQCPIRADINYISFGSVKYENEIRNIHIELVQKCSILHQAPLALKLCILILKCANCYHPKFCRGCLKRKCVEPINEKSATMSFTKTNSSLSPFYKFKNQY